MQANRVNGHAIRAKREFNRLRAQMAAQIAGPIACYDSLSSKVRGKGELHSRRDIAEAALGIADEIIKLIQEKERF